MTHVIEWGAYGIIGLSLVQVVVALYGLVWRRLAETRHARHMLTVFAQRVRIDAERRLEEQRHAALSWEGWRKFRIDRKVRETEDICSFYLTAHDGKPIPSFLPGQHIAVSLDIPNQTAPVIRCYTLSEAPSAIQTHYRITVKRVRPFALGQGIPSASNFLYDSLEEGATVDIRMPEGRFFLDVNDDRPVVMVGGGIGITPFISMLTALAHAPKRREAWLFYGVRNEAQEIMHEHLRRLAKSCDTLHVLVCHSAPVGPPGTGYDYRGHVTIDMLRQTLPASNYLFYVCGPPPMMEAITSGLRAWGVPDKDIRIEAFTPDSIRAGDGGRRPGGQEGARIVFNRSGKTLQWTGEQHSLLDLAEANGIILATGCRTGKCGACTTSVLRGSICHVDEPPATFDHEQKRCLVCIAVPNSSELVLDA
ncbi:MAG: Uncharacterized protein FD149_37 [Rhodospirillaceae bacterium]|nr:MAG: Uncharacterized protein FD149_37 [Rhodospirillaceae bacterium]